MPIEVKTPPNKIYEYLIKRTQNIEQAIIYRMQKIAEEVVNEARLKADFTDQTGNLRSSIGAILSVDGQVIQSYGFEVVKDGAEGARDGKSFAEQLITQYPTGICLVVVAGKNYAKYLVAKGYDVLTSGELLLERRVPEMLKEIGMN